MCQVLVLAVIRSYRVLLTQTVFLSTILLHPHPLVPTAHLSHRASIILRLDRQAGQSVIDNDSWLLTLNGQIRPDRSSLSRAAAMKWLAMQCLAVLTHRAYSLVSSSNGMTTRYRARVAYDGAGFLGFQVQPNRRTIQGALEEVLSKRFNRPVRVVGASRTDAGVHARGQAIHFDLTETPNVTDLERSLNKMLRQDVRIWNIQTAPTVVKLLNNRVQEVEWNAMFDADKKLYSYRISIGNQMDPLARHTRFQVPWPNTDIEVLTRCLKRFEGHRDFRAFAGGMDQLERKLGASFDTWRSVYSVDIADKGHGLYRIEVVLKGALYKMIRNMVGTALHVAFGKMDEEEFNKYW